MSRLVDIEDVKNFINGLDSLPWEEEIDELLEIIPTAYDVGKVALELRHLAFRLPKDYSGLDGKDRAVMFDDAIDIVKRGGAE